MSNVKPFVQQTPVDIIKQAYRNNSEAGILSDLWKKCPTEERINFLDMAYKTFALVFWDKLSDSVKTFYQSSITQSEELLLKEREKNPYLLNRAHSTAVKFMADTMDFLPPGQFEVAFKMVGDVILDNPSYRSYGRRTLAYFMHDLAKKCISNQKDDVLQHILKLYSFEGDYIPLGETAVWNKNKTALDMIANIIDIRTNKNALLKTAALDANVVMFDYIVEKLPINTVLNKTNILYSVMGSYHYKLPSDKEKAKQFAANRRVIVHKLLEKSDPNPIFFNVLDSFIRARRPNPAFEEALSDLLPYISQRSWYKIQKSEAYKTRLKDLPQYQRRLLSNTVNNVVKGAVQPSKKRKI